MDWKDSGLSATSACNEDVMTKLRACYGGHDLQSRRLFYRVPKDLCAKSSAVQGWSHNSSLLRSRSTTRMSLSMPSAPSGGLFKQGYQKYVLFSASVQDLQ